MRIGYVMTEGKGDTDLLLAGFARLLMQRGLRLCGTVQVNTDCGEGRLCDMDVLVLPEGPTIRISQSLGPGARGCRLDPEALEQAVFHAETRLLDGADLVIVNKFGKHEGEGHGFRNLIAEAIAREVPVLVGINRLNEQKFQEFTGGLARRVDADTSALLAWIEADDKSS